MTHQSMLHSDRRKFLQAVSAAGSGLALEKVGFGRALGAAREKRIAPTDLVKLQPDLEPLVRLIETTERKDCFAAITAQIRKGLSYRNLTAALFLAGIRNITSTSVGGPLHAVLVIHSAHQMALDSSPDEQLLPMFWALDNFKAVQARKDRLEKMQEFSGLNLSASSSSTELEKAMAEFDPDRAEAAMVSMLSNFGASQVIERMWEYGARDYRNIGHKAIYVANGWRTLNTIGWRHSGPAMRHIARALAAFDSSDRRSGFTMDEQSYAGNKTRVKNGYKKLPSNWATSLDAPSIVTELLEAMRTANHDEACDLVIRHLISGKARAGTVWDAVHLMAGEIVLRNASIRPVHAVTSANAIRFAFNQSSSSTTRLLLVLQAVGWMCHFIDFIRDSTAPFPKKNIEAIKERDIPNNIDEALAQVFDLLSVNPERAVECSYTLAKRHQLSTEYIRTARSLIYRKGTESHRYKFPAAALEDVRLISPRWRPHFLAATTVYMCGSRMPDSAIMKKARESLAN